MGEFLLGRNIGLFGADAILNDMTLPGVGAGGGNYATPANTSLGSIGFGYIYTDWLAQIDYTTRDFGGFKVTLGIFDPLEPLGQELPPGTTAPPESAPGWHAKAVFKTRSLLFLRERDQPETQWRNGRIRLRQFRIRHWRQDHTWRLVEFLAWYYQGEGLGTTALFLLASDGLGEERDSDGFLAQVTYKFDELKLGLNYGESNLDLAPGEAVSNLVAKNQKYTVGAYYSLTENLTLLGGIYRYAVRSAQWS